MLGMCTIYLLKTNPKLYATTFHPPPSILAACFVSTSQTTKYSYSFDHKCSSFQSKDFNCISASL